jgi:hypothetical protein
MAGRINRAGVEFVVSTLKLTVERSIWSWRMVFL